MRWSDEQEAVFRSEGNVLVSASAGSGKTTVMIEKMLRLIEEGQDLSRILAMTFSRASAQDMKTKLVKKMHERLSFGQSSELIAKQLNNIPFANICTINSFCYALMKRYFTVVGADPSCSILDEKEAEKLWSESFDRILERKTEERKEAFLKALEYFSQNRKTDGMKKTVYRLRTFLCSQEDPEAFLKNAASSSTEKMESYYLGVLQRKASRLVASSDTLSRMLEEENVKDDAMSLFIKELKIFLSETERDPKIKSFFRVDDLAVPSKYNIRLVTSGKISQELYDRTGEFLAEVKNFKKLVSDGEEVYGKTGESFVMEELLDLYRAVETEYKRRKKARLAVDFNDAERAALVILKNDEVRKEIRDSFDYVFIDEYQDTNYLQEAILQGVCRGDNLFAVGDVKQAIYLFRFAEPKIFNERKKVYSAVEGEGTNRNLNGNYRSCKGVLDFTNEICARTMTEEFGGVDYSFDAMLHQGETDEKKDEPVDPVTIYTYPKTKTDKKTENGSIYRVKTAEKADESDLEADFVAAEIQRMYVEEGRKYEDITVLVRKNKQAETVLDALKKHDVPCFYTRQTKTVLPQRETLIDCLRLLLNDSEDISLVNVMSSDWIGFSAEELIKIRLYSPGETFAFAVENYNGEEALKQKIADFRTRLGKWRFDAEYLSVADLMREILKDGYDATLMRDREVITQINSFVLFVEQQAERMSLGEFIAYYDEIYDGNQAPAPASAVKVMTLHASKGLQFPVVFMPYLSVSFQNTNDKKEHVVCDRDFGMAIKHFDEEGRQTKKTFPIYVLGLKRDYEEKEGELRLAYVAFTRAQEKLILIGEENDFGGESEDASCVMDWLTLARKKNGALEKYFRPLTMPETAAVVSPPTRRKSLSFWQMEGTYPFEKATKTYAKTSVSGILEKTEERGVKVLPAAADAQKTEVGNAMHAALRYIDFSAKNAEEVRCEVEKEVKEKLLSKEEAALVDCEKIAAFLNAPEIVAIKSYPKHREYPFISYDYPPEGGVDKILVQGIIDLLVDLPDGTCMLVDYKMSSLGSESLKNRYAEQIVLYKKAVENILHKPVSVSLLYNLYHGYFVRL